MNERKFRDIYAEVIALWPQEIDVSKKHIFANGGMRCERLNEAHDKVEEYIYERTYQSVESHDWFRNVDWSIFTILHIKIKEENIKVIYPFFSAQENEVLALCLGNEDFKTDWEE